MNDDPLGFVETPPALADWLAAEALIPQLEAGDRVLYPGAGRGTIAAAVHRRCSVRDLPAHEAVAVERDEQHIPALEERFVGPDATDNHGVPRLADDSAERHRAYRSGIARAPVDVDFRVQHADVLAAPPGGQFDYIVANPPYTAYEHIGREDRERYAERFKAAQGAFPLYVPFVEQMLDLLAPDGICVCLLPVQWLTAGVTRPLRNCLRHAHPLWPTLAPDSAFPDHKVTTTVLTFGRTGCNWGGRDDAPSETRIQLEPAHFQTVDYQLRGYGFSGDDLADAKDEYRETYNDLNVLVRNRDERDREELDSADRGRQQPLGRFA